FSTTISRIPLKQVASAPASPAHEVWRSGRVAVAGGGWSDLGARSHCSSSSSLAPPLSQHSCSANGGNFDGGNPFRAFGGSRPMAKHPERLDIPPRFLPPKSASMNGPPPTYQSSSRFNYNTTTNNDNNHNNTLGGGGGGPPARSQSSSSPSMGVGAAGDLLQRSNSGGAGLQFVHLRPGDGWDLAAHQAGGYQGSSGRRSPLLRSGGAAESPLIIPGLGARGPDDFVGVGVVDPTIFCGTSRYNETIPPQLSPTPPPRPPPSSPPPPLSPRSNGETTSGSQQGGGFGSGDVLCSPRAGRMTGGQAGSRGDTLSSPLHSPPRMQAPLLHQEVAAIARVIPTDGRHQGGQEDPGSVRSQQSTEAGPRMITRLRSALNAERTARVIERQRIMELEGKVCACCPLGANVLLV
ncbi:hypothetical protein CBR_g73965, partial [Chara braunii]